MSTPSLALSSSRLARSSGVPVRASSETRRGAAGREACWLATEMTTVSVGDTAARLRFLGFRRGDSMAVRGPGSRRRRVDLDGVDDVEEGLRPPRFLPSTPTLLRSAAVPVVASAARVTSSKAKLVGAAVPAAAEGDRCLMVGLQLAREREQRFFYGEPRQCPAARTSPGPMLNDAQLTQCPMPDEKARCPPPFTSRTPHSRRSRQFGSAGKCCGRPPRPAPRRLQ